VINLIKSEVLKIRSTQVWFWMLVLSITISALFTIGTMVDAVHNHDAGNPVDYYTIFTTSQTANVALLVLGLLGLTTEFRHQTITPTLLATPNRWRMLGGKAASYGVFAMVYAAVCLAVNFAIAIPWLSAKNIPIEFSHGVPGGVLKVYILLVLYGLLGLGLGALIRNQAAAMVFGILLVTLLGIMLATIPYVRRVYPFEPGGAAQAFMANGKGDSGFGDVHLLPPIAGGLVLAAWAVALFFLGGFLSLRRDIS
jgi:ABC-2 type transport system permease protein